MKKLILVALTGMASLANSTPLNTSDSALLAGINQAQYQALIYTANECRFEPGTTLAVTLLKSSAMPAITAAVSKYNTPAPVLDGAACAALAKA
jgi:hypothetical protein